MSIKETLVTANAIQVKVRPQCWQEAIQIAAQPLIDGGYITVSYQEEIIRNTEQNGPYYIFEDEGIAIPHARPESGVLKNAFSLVLLEEPISIQGSTAIDILVLFGAVDSNAHIQEGLGAIIGMLEDEDKMNRLRQAQTIEEVIELL